MEKEYISTIVIDSESAAENWRDLPTPKREDATKDNSVDLDESGEYSGVSTWVS